MMILDNPKTIGAYVHGIVARLDHHGVGSGITSIADFKAMAMATLGDVLMTADSPPQAKTYNGHLANVVWADFKGRRYAFVFSHNGWIEVKSRNMRGNVVHKIDETTSAQAVSAMVASL